MKWNNCNNLEIYRNCEYEYPLVLVDTSGFAENLFGWQFAFVIAGTNPDRTFGPAIITKLSPIISGNSVTFFLNEHDTALLLVSKAYEYRAMAKPPGIDQGVLEFGQVFVRDAPLVFP